jgi:hypothetical protein
MWRFLKSFYRASRVSLQVSWGEYLYGGIEMKSLIGWPKTHIAGESCVSLSGVFLHWSIARWNVSVSSSSLGPVLSAIRRLSVLAPTSALQLLWGKDTEDRRWCTPQSWRNYFVAVAVAVNSGPPSDASSSGITKATNVRRKQVTSPVAPFEDLSLNNWSVWVSVNYDKVTTSNPLELKKVRTDALKRVVRRHQRCRWSTWVRRCYPITMIASGS